MEPLAYNPRFERSIDKKQIPTCPVMGVEVAAVNMEWLLHFINGNIKELSGDYICVSNVHTTVMAYEDPEYRKIQNGGILAIPDGGPLSSLGRKRGYTQMQRTAGPSLMEEILKISVEQGYRHYFYGSTMETLEKMRGKLMRDYPGLKIAGMYSPPFRALSEAENQAVSEKINAAGVDFIWVGLGAPKQEVWMAEHQGKLEGLMIGVGAAFDYFAGNIRRAPRWMQNHNLEWLFRMMQDPKRLFGRYLRTNARFIWNAYIRGN